MYDSRGSKYDSRDTMYVSGDSMKLGPVYVPCDFFRLTFFSVDGNCSSPLSSKWLLRESVCVVSPVRNWPIFSLRDSSMCPVLSTYTLYKYFVIRRCGEFHAVFQG